MLTLEVGLAFCLDLSACSYLLGVPLWDYLRCKVIDYFLLQLKGIVNTSFFWNLSDLYIDFAVIFLSLA